MVIMEPIGPVAAFTPWNFPRHAGGPQNRGSAGRRLLHHRVQRKHPAHRSVSSRRSTMRACRPLRFKETDDVLQRANKLPFGLASCAFSKDAKVARSEERRVGKGGRS